MLSRYLHTYLDHFCQFRRAAWNGEVECIMQWLGNPEVFGVSIDLKDESGICSSLSLCFHATHINLLISSALDRENTLH